MVIKGIWQMIKQRIEQETGLTEKDTRLIRRRLKHLNESQHFYTFDHFMMKKWLDQDGIKRLKKCNDLEELNILRKKAYKNFYKKISKLGIASRNTILTWFGLGSIHVPKRRHIFHMAIELQFSEEELQEYLIQGLLENGVQVCDYQELIYLYVCKNRLSWQQAQDMIFIFEKRFVAQTEISKTHGTSDIWRMFRENEEKEPEEFLAWMCENRAVFKGYSLIAIQSFIQLKDEVLSYVREDATESLYSLLEETNFFEWMAEEKISRENWKTEVPRFIKNVSRRKKKNLIPKETKEMIADLDWIIQDSKGRNTDLLAEIYASAIEIKESYRKQRIIFRKREEFALPRDITFMTNKYVSLILGIAAQKEKEIRLLHNMSVLMEYSEEEECPEEIREYMFYYSGKDIPQKVGEVKKMLGKFLIEQKNRCTNLRRDDLLPLIQYVSQRRYCKRLKNTEENYQAEEAKQYFIDLADEILKKCQMNCIDEKYHMDYLLLSCYGEQEMYTMSDIIEESMEI